MGSNLAHNIVQALGRPDVIGDLGDLGVKKVLVATDDSYGMPGVAVYGVIDADMWRFWSVPRSSNGWKMVGIAGHVALRLTSVLHNNAAWFPNLHVATVFKLCRDNGVDVNDENAAPRFQRLLNGIIAGGRSLEGVSCSDDDREMGDLYGWWQSGAKVGWAELTYIPDTADGRLSDATIAGIAWALRETPEEIADKEDEIRRQLASSPLVLNIA